jgi:hypothetical protein
MQLVLFSSGRGLLRIMTLCLALLAGAALSSRSASASEYLIAAAQTANNGLAACNNSTGTALYTCVANVLERMNSEISPANVPDTQRAIGAAVSGLRSAANKVQALAAITQCQGVIANALKLVKAAGGAYVRGWGDTGLTAIAGVLARAARLIQAKG